MEPNNLKNGNIKSLLEKANNNANNNINKNSNNINLSNHNQKNLSNQKVFLKFDCL